MALSLPREGRTPGSGVDVAVPYRFNKSLNPNRLAQFAAQNTKDHSLEWSHCCLLLSNFGRGEWI
jgi:hypothetical protein